MLNFINFVTCTCLFFQCGTLSNIPSLAFFCAAASIFIFAIAKFILDPDSFGYFRYSFRYTEKSPIYELSFRHYLVWIGVLTLALFFTVIANTLCFLPLIPLFLFFIFTLIYHPYKERIENYRSAFFIFVMCSMSAIKVFIQYSPKPIHNTVGLNLLLLFNFVLFLLAVVAVSLASNIYYYVYITYILSKLYLEDEAFVCQREKHELLELIQFTNVKDKMKWTRDNENVFKKVSLPRKSLFEYSNQLFREAKGIEKDLLTQSSERKHFKL